jgi:hypothetical protein
MSDTVYSTVTSSQRVVPISVIDETWEHEMLSDDGKSFLIYFSPAPYSLFHHHHFCLEIEIPKEIDCVKDEIEKDLEDVESCDGDDDDTWSDPGMDLFTQDYR